MKIFIPTRGRWSTLSTSTAALIPNALKSYVVLATHDSEVEQYAESVPHEWLDLGLTVRGFSYDKIAEKRLKMGIAAREEGHEQFFMLDDDIDFLIRKHAQDFPLRAQYSDDVIEMFNYLRELVRNGSFSHVGVSGREGNNQGGNGTREELLAHNTRCMRFVCYNTEDFLSVEHCRVDVMEDFDVTLQLLRKGRPNAVSFWYANGQKMTNAPGGCSLWRTRELHNASASKLAQLHAPYVSLRQKENKTDREGLGTRLEVTVHWKKAYKSAFK